jgi:hypothetical protein
VSLPRGLIFYALCVRRARRPCSCRAGAPGSTRPPRSARARASEREPARYARIAHARRAIDGALQTLSSLIFILADATPVTVTLLSNLYKKQMPGARASPKAQCATHSQSPKNTLSTTTPFKSTNSQSKDSHSTKQLVYQKPKRKPPNAIKNGTQN